MTRIKKFLLVVMFTIFSPIVYANNLILDTLVQQQAKTFMTTNHVVGMTIQFINHGKGYAYYFGYANKSTKTKMSPDTIFDIGSISKVFTTLLLAIEIQQGNMNLQDSAAKYLPVCKNHCAFSQITLFNLATHTSSLPFNLSSQIKNKTQLNNYLNHWQPNFAVGTQWAYSNLGIGLLSAAIENITPGDYDAVYIKNILTPLGMQNIACDLPGHFDSQNAQGYSGAGDIKPDSDMDILPGSWAIKATGPDMMKFLAAAIGLPTVPANIRAAMQFAQTPYIQIGDEQEGLGWEIHDLTLASKISLLQPRRAMSLGPFSATVLPTVQQQYNPNKLIDKTGSWNGFRAYIAVIPQTQSGIVIMVNSEVSNGNMRQLGRKLLFLSTDDK